MTAAQIKFKKQLIQKIQVFKSNVFIDDESRREFMLSRFGVDSTTKMSIDQLKLLCDFCNRKVSDIPVDRATEAQVKKIYDLWFEKARDKSLDALYSFIFRITKKDVSEVAELLKCEATKVIVALSKMD
ncbi:MAG: hypothetical protein C0625_02015 [Arcobacter sp.]|mgnify:CR=1 FL=1|nr:MAG: hypothetical protein C0625_02015 [Arcobacter sp.]